MKQINPLLMLFDRLSDLVFFDRSNSFFLFFLLSHQSSSIQEPEQEKAAAEEGKEEKRKVLEELNKTEIKACRSPETVESKEEKRLRNRGD